MSGLGYVAIAFECAEELLKSGRCRRVSCVVADVQLPGMRELELHQRLLACAKPIPTILITAYIGDSVRERALAAGVIGYLSKPFEEDDRLACIRPALTPARGGGR